jgi:hypothetical protein
MRTHFTVKNFASVAIGGLALASGALFASNQTAIAASNLFIEQVRQQLIRVAVESDLAGYSLTHEPMVDTLSNRYYDTVTLNLRSGMRYGLVGVCDSDCRDLDLRLYDGNGNLVDADTSPDDTPVVGITPRWSGQFYLRVSMANCRTNYCYYGVGVFGR